VDASTSSDVEDPCEEEDKGGEDRQNPEANRGRDTAKGIQPRIVTRLPGLKLRRASPRLCYQLNPRRARGLFIEPPAKRRVFSALYPRSASRHLVQRRVRREVVELCR
jgi:hypothetical protein